MTALNNIYLTVLRFNTYFLYWCVNYRIPTEIPLIDVQTVIFQALTSNQQIAVQNFEG